MQRVGCRTPILLAARLGRLAQRIGGGLELLGQLGMRRPSRAGRLLERIGAAGGLCWVVGRLLLELLEIAGGLLGIPRLVRLGLASRRPRDVPRQVRQPGVLGSCVRIAQLGQLLLDGSNLRQRLLPVVTGFAELLGKLPKLLLQLVAARITCAGVLLARLVRNLFDLLRHGVARVAGRLAVEEHVVLWVGPDGKEEHQPKGRTRRQRRASGDPGPKRGSYFGGAQTGPGVRQLPVSQLRGGGVLRDRFDGQLDRRPEALAEP
ncbi:MAG: hypothetical protein E6J39_06665 [Chloroflexi bacterium]|nr:MAG: hypothetical protein E6J39_06665 [Chloroflexota bacterium]